MLASLKQKLRRKINRCMYTNKFIEMEKVRWLFNFKTWNPTLEDVSLALSLIQLEEKSRIMQFVFKKDAKASLIGRLMMHKYVSENAKIPWNEIQFSRSEKGKPFVVYPKANKNSLIDFNVSHQGSYCAFASDGNNKIGVDIMEVEKCKKDIPEFFRIMRRQFSSSEWDHIYSFQTELEQLRAFYRNWCLKESYVKCAGTGITVNLQAISFTSFSNLNPNITVKDTIVKVDNEHEKEWIFEETLLNDDHIFTVAFSSDCRSSSICSNIPLKYITFNELISDGLSLSGDSVIEAKAFIEKPENPQSYR